MEAFHFLRPWWLLALVPWLLLSWRLRRGDVRRGAWHAVCDESLLPFVLEGGARGRQGGGIVVLALAGVLAIVALAGPAWREIPQPVYRHQEALVVVLDLSRSMGAADIRPSRLERARLKVLDLVRRRQDGQTALVVFAGDAFAVTPLTDDVNTISALVPSLTTDLMPAAGTRTDRALDLAASLLKQSGAGSGRVVLITDGVGAAGVEAAVSRLRESGHRLSVIGAGTPEGAPIPAGDGGFLTDGAGQIIVPQLPEARLQALARAGNGHYARLSLDDYDLTQVLGGASADWSAVRDVAGLTSDRWREEGPWLLLVLLPVASLAFRRGLLALLVCVLLSFPDPAAAMDWGSLWHNRDQQGELAFQAREYRRAAEAFRDPAWRAAALYRAGRFEEAAAVLERLRQPDALYNRANALAQLGRFEEAMALYEDVLRAQPGHEDARHNLDLLRGLKPPPPPPAQDGAQDSESPRSSRGEQGGSPPEDSEAGGAPRPEKGDESMQSGAGEASRDPAGSSQQTVPPTVPEQDPAQSPTANQQQNADADQGDDKPSRASAGDDLSPPADESRQAMEQWLRRIPDDPGGLLRRKFRYQYSRRDRAEAAAAEPW